MKKTRFHAMHKCSFGVLLKYFLRGLGIKKEDLNYTQPVDTCLVDISCPKGGH